MNNLICVIGKAPSEALEEFLVRLRTERLRVSQGLQAIRERRKNIATKGSKKKASSPKVSKEVISLLQGVDDLEDFFKFAKAEMEKR